MGVESWWAMHAGRGIGRSRPACHEADAGPARELALGLSHHRGAALAADGDGDVGVMQSVENGQVALTGYAEQRLDTMGDELAHQDLAAGARGEGRRHCGLYCCGFQRLVVRGGKQLAQGVAQGQVQAGVLGGMGFTNHLV
jgi:hypothetical protein